METVSDKNEMKRQLITQIEEQLKEIKDVDILLENILSGARKLVNADAGSIYEYDAKENKLRIRYSQNDTKQKELAPGEKLAYTSYSFIPTKQYISGYCLLSKKLVNIEDAYNLPEYIDEEKTEKRPYEFNELSDVATGYKTHSILTIPLIMTNGKVLGVLQIINAQDEGGNVIPFDKIEDFFKKSLR